MRSDESLSWSAAPLSSMDAWIGGPAVTLDFNDEFSKPFHIRSRSGFCRSWEKPSLLDVDISL